MRIVWAPGAWQDYLYWSRTDVRVRDKINALIGDIQRHRFSGVGKPGPLKRNLRGFWSWRITREHRLVYRVERGILEIAQCRIHYQPEVRPVVLFKRAARPAGMNLRTGHEAILVE